MNAEPPPPSPAPGDGAPSAKPEMSAAARMELKMMALLDPTDVEELPAFLVEKGWKIARYADWGGIKMLKCSRPEGTVLLAVMQPKDWAKLQDGRRHLRIATATPISFWRFWRRPVEQKLAQQILREIREWVADEPE